jgi:hypothetical protein
MLGVYLLPVAIALPSLVVKWSPVNGITVNGIIWLVGSIFLRLSRPV